MTSRVLQWEEDWFSVETEERKREEVEKEVDAEKDKEEEKDKEAEKDKEVEKVEKEEKERKTEEEKAWKARMEDLIQKQSERLTALEEEVRILKEQPPRHASSKVAVSDLLEEWKQVKERELNYALRRRQPVPFFPLESMIRWERAIHPTGAGAPSLQHSSPLFRHQVMKEREREEKDVESLIRGMDAIKL